MEEFLKIVIVVIVIALGPWFFSGLLHLLMVLNTVRRIRKGHKYERTMDFEKALEAYNKAIDFNPNSLLAYYSRGFLYEKKLGKYEKAIEGLNKVIALDPNYAIAYNNRGLLYEKLGDNQKAISDLREACLLGHSEACEELKKLTR